MGSAPKIEAPSGDPVLDAKRREYQYAYENLSPAKIPMVATLPAAERADTAFMMQWLGVASRMTLGNQVPGAIRWIARWMNPIYWKRIQRGVRALRESEDVHNFPGVRVPTTYALLCHRNPHTPVTRTWNLDQEFARQRLAGVDPTVIRCLSSLDDLPTPDLVPPQRLLDQILGRTPEEESLGFEKLAAAGRLYVCDYRERLGGLAFEEGRNMALPYAVFAWRERRGAEAGRLMPVSIMLEEGGHIFFPDQRTAWSVAKYWVQCADTVHADMWSHVTQAHLVGGPFVISTHRHLPPGHPIFELLFPHFQLALRINDQLLGGAAQKLYNRNTPYTRDSRRQLIQRAWTAWDFTKNSVRADLTDRGVMNLKGLPDYPYRDDILTLFEPVERFARAYVETAYSDDSAVACDMRLQAWYEELSAKPEHGGGDIKGLPRPDSRETLSFIMTEMLMHFGPKHSAVHSPAFDYGGFGPNSTTFIRGEIPGNAADVEPLFDYFPPLFDALKNFSLHCLVSNIPYGQFTGYGDGMPRWGRDLASRLQKDLVDAEETIRARNAKRFAQLGMDYPYLAPSAITNSILA